MYSCWTRKENKWITLHADENTQILLSIISAGDKDKKDDGDETHADAGNGANKEDIKDDEEPHDDAWAVLALLVNQDVMQRVPLTSCAGGEERMTFLGGESCMLVMSGQSYKWRVEVQEENYLVEVLDRMRGIGLQWVEVMCLASWQKEITMVLIKEWLSDSEYTKIMDEMCMKSEIVTEIKNDTDLLGMVEKLLSIYFLESGLECIENINDDSDDLLNISKDLLDDNLI